MSAEMRGTLAFIARLPIYITNEEDNHGFRKRCIALAARRTAADHSVAGFVLASLKLSVAIFRFFLSSIPGLRRPGMSSLQAFDHNSTALIAPEADFV
jgi:hypothetical protein